MSTPSNSRPSSSLSRPSSSLSQRQPISRPSSSTSQRPTSRASTTRRPRSSTSSARPISSASGRPQSRFSQRTQSRLGKSRVNPFARTIVTQVTGLKEDDDTEEYKKSVDYVVKSLEAITLNKGAASVDMKFVEQQINGHALKARITMNDVVSEGLLLALNKLQNHIEVRGKDLDHDIQTTHIPDHLQFLINLSQPPTTTTTACAEQLLSQVKNPRPWTPVLTWKDILAEEPFEGEHWEGILDKPNAEHEWDTTPSLSPLSSDNEDDKSVSSLGFGEPGRSRHSLREVESPNENTGEHPLPEKVALGSNVPPHTHAHRKEYEELREIQYWRRDWKGCFQPSKRFNIGDPSTLGPAFVEVLAQKHDRAAAARALLQNVCYIREEDMVREVYMALQGRRNIVLAWQDEGHSYAIAPGTPHLAHLTLASQDAILSVLAKIATTLEHLRRFRSSIYALSYDRYHENSTTLSIKPRSTTQTMEAFADAIDAEIRAFDTWCADQEAAICGVCTLIQPANPTCSDVITSLLHVSKCLSDTFEHTFPVLLQITQDVFSHALSPSSEFRPIYIASTACAPAPLTAKLLDILFTTVQMHLEREEVVTSGRLMRVFMKTAEPVWGMCGRWLKEGMGLGIFAHGENHRRLGGVGGLDDEFFIEARIFSEPTAGLLHPQFWQEAYGLRENLEEWDEADSPSKEQKVVPMFLEHVAEMILRSGKAVGLIRALGANLQVSGDGQWESFQNLVTVQGHTTEQNSEHLFSVSVDILSRLIYERLLPRCQTVGNLLTKILIDECKLWRHLEALEGLFLMRRGDAMSHFTDIVFNKMDSKQAWSDFHFLNTAFADVVEANLNAGAREWIQPSLVRFAYRGGKEKERTIFRTVKAADGISVEYTVPFPLTYIFRPTVVIMYGEVLVFLLQIRRAKNVLERILIRGDQGQSFGEGLKVFYAMRSRLSWFINTLLNFLTTYVIHAQVINFHKQLQEAQSFDDMIQLHDEHLDKIQSRCLLKRNTSALHRAILSILDMSLQFSDFFGSFTRDVATHDVSRYSLFKRHRSRRQRRRRQNVIGFSRITDDEISSSDDDNDRAQEPEVLNDPTIETVTFSTMNATGSPEEIGERLDKFTSELDGLVRFIRRGVESLAGGASEGASAFGVLAFALEDWDA